MFELNNIMLVFNFIVDAFDGSTALFSTPLYEYTYVPMFQATEIFL